MNIWALVALAGSAVVVFVADWVRLGQAQQTGAQIEAGKVSAVSATAEAAIAEVEANAPTGPAATLSLLDQWKNGTF